jgi:glutathione synthase/RimK-type ligase-like ATP-grasp enzyme
LPWQTRWDKIQPNYVAIAVEVNLKYTIAIQPDDYGNGDACSPIWERSLKKKGHEVRIVNVYTADIMDQIKGCQGFMWRHGHYSDMRQIARRLLPVLEKEIGIVVYPDQDTCWHYDDKIIQRYLLEAAGIPIPRTWVWYEVKSALDWARTAEYPLVIKLWSGAGSKNVRLVSSFGEAEIWIKKLFGSGLHYLDEEYSEKWPMGKKRIRAALRLLVKGYIPARKPPKSCWDLHKNYVLFQEFLPGNPFDHRVVIIGNRAFAFRRFNRPNDFRASGGGNVDINPKNIDLETVRLSFRLAKKLKTQSIAIDILRRGEERVVGEISYTYPPWNVQKSLGHWELTGDPVPLDLKWKTGQMWPAEAQVSDFLDRLKTFFNG